MLGLGNFRSKTRQFEYKPRYFDPAKEARDARRIEILGLEDNDVEANSEKAYRPGEYIRGSMYVRRGIGSSNTSQANGVMKKVSLLIVMMFIAAMMWLLA